MNSPNLTKLLLIIGLACLFSVFLVLLIIVISNNQNQIDNTSLSSSENRFVGIQNGIHRFPMSFVPITLKIDFPKRFLNPPSSVSLSVYGNQFKIYQLYASNITRDNFEISVYDEKNNSLFRTDLDNLIKDTETIVSYRMVLRDDQQPIILFSTSSNKLLITCPTSASGQTGPQPSTWIDPILVTTDIVPESGYFDILKLNFDTTINNEGSLLGIVFVSNTTNGQQIKFNISTDKSGLYYNSNTEIIVSDEHIPSGRQPMRLNYDQKSRLSLLLSTESKQLLVISSDSNTGNTWTSITNINTRTNNMDTDYSYLNSYRSSLSSKRLGLFTFVETDQNTQEHMLKIVVVKSANIYTLSTITNVTSAIPVGITHYKNQIFCSAVDQTDTKLKVFVADFSTSTSGDDELVLSNFVPLYQVKTNEQTVYGSNMTSNYYGPIVYFSQSENNDGQAPFIHKIYQIATDSTVIGGTNVQKNPELIQAETQETDQLNTGIGSVTICSNTQSGFRILSSLGACSIIWKAVT